MDRQLPGIMLCGSPPLEHENTSEALKLRDLGETLYFMQSHVVGSPTAFVSMASE